MAKARPKPLAPAELLAQQLSAVLQAQTGRTPFTLREAAAALPSPQPLSDADLLAALACKPLKAAAVLAIPGDVSAPVALKTAKATLAADERLLRQLLARSCSPQIPTVTPTLLAPLLETSLRAPFKKHWTAQLKAQRLPAGVRAAAVHVGKRAELAFHDARFPLPWESLSQQLLQALERTPARLATLSDWAALVAPQASPELLAHAAQAAPFANQVAPAFPKQPTGLLFLPREAAAVAASDALLSALLTQSLKPTERAIAADLLAKSKLLHPALQAAFAAALENRLLQRRLPPGVAALRVKKWLLLFQDDLLAGDSRRTSAAPSPPPAVDTSAAPSAPGATAPLPVFAADFSAAFERLDAQHGYSNLIKLYDLRLALPHYARPQFDQGLNDLRRQRRFSLTASEGSFTALSDAEREAGLVEAGVRLIYCSKIR